MITVLNKWAYRPLPSGASVERDVNGVTGEVIFWLLTSRPVAAWRYLDLDGKGKRWHFVAIGEIRSQSLEWEAVRQFLLYDPGQQGLD